MTLVASTFRIQVAIAIIGLEVTLNAVGVSVLLAVDTVGVAVIEGEHQKLRNS